MEAFRIILFAVFGLAIGSFLNVCIDRLPPKLFLHLTGDKGGKLDIEVANKAFIDEPDELFKDKDVVVTGEVILDKITGRQKIYVANSSQIVLKEAAVPDLNPLEPAEVLDSSGQVAVAGRITEITVKKSSLVSPPSHCDSCGHRLNVLEYIPVVSYLVLKGKCRYCGARIPVRVLIVETLTAALFLLAYWRYGLTIQFPITFFWSCIFLLTIYIDWEHTLILDKITLPCMAIAVALLAVNAFVPGSNLYGDRLFAPHNSLYSGLISGGALFVIFFLVVLITGSMGFGDVKLVALIGLVSGFPLMIFSMLIGIVIGGVVAIVLLVTRKKGRKDVIPYGTFLAIGPIVAMLLPGGVMNWYLSAGH